MIGKKHTLWLRITTLLLALLCIFAFAACTNDPADTPAGGDDPAPGAPARKTLRILGLKGPTGMGMAKLVSDNASNRFAYEFSLYGAPGDLTPLILQGNYDIAPVPTNVAANLYQKTNGALQVIAVETLGVLSVLENGNTVQSFADLSGKDIYYFGQGSTPQYILEYLLRQSNMTANLIPVARSEELSAMLATNRVAVGVLPEPAVTSTLLQAKGTEGNTALRKALDLNDVWRAVAPEGTAQVQGCLIARKGFLDEVGAEGITAFLEEYARSAAFAVEHPAEASTVIEGLGIVPKAAIAKTALQNLGNSVCCITGEAMQTMLLAFCDILYAADPQSMGGVKPNEALCFIPTAAVPQP